MKIFVDPLGDYVSIFSSGASDVVILKRVWNGISTNFSCDKPKLEEMKFKNIPEFSQFFVYMDNKYLEYVAFFSSEKLFKRGRTIFLISFSKNL